MRKILLIIPIFFNIFLFSQEQNLWLEQSFTNQVIGKINGQDSIFHTSFLPLIKTNNSFFEKDNLLLLEESRKDFFATKKHEKLWSKIFYDDLITIKENNLTFSINTLFNINKTKLKEDLGSYWQNTRGFEIHGNLGKNLSFYTDFYENQAYFLPYIDQNVENRFVIPGQGAWKIYGADKLGKDYNYASGYISFSPTKNINLQIGHSKNFIGSGYRSLLLSDNSFHYPFLKFTYTKRKIQYTIMYTEFQSFKTKYYFYHYKKHGSFLLLNYSPIANIELGFFEGIIWKTSDNITYVKKFPALFFIPLPIIREIAYGLNNENNILLGLNFRAKFYKYGDIYGQIAIDDISKESFYNRYGIQAGLKIYDVFAEKIKKQNLFIEIEYNYTKPYMYTQENTYSAYTNMNEALTSTLGAGYNEMIGILNYKFYGFEITAQINKIISSEDTTGTNFGTNLLLSNYTSTFQNTKNYVGQGLRSDILIKKISLAYIINAKTNLQIFIELESRKYQTEITKDDLFFVSFGFKNKIQNIYTDY